MKIREIDIENFGIFTDRHFDFGESPFQLIHGPNEAGKSTLLQLLRQLLFGFPTRSEFQFDTHSGEMAARALIDTFDDRRISFRRRKGRKDTVVGEVEGTTEKINDTDLNGILGNASLDLYQHVFGFSLTELSRGEESLKHANLNEAMFGGSLGSPSNLQEIQKSLEDEAANLFKSGTATKPLINSLLREIRDQNSAIKEATLKPREFDEKEKALRDAEEQVNLLNAEREKSEKQRAHLERLCQAVEPWLEQKAIQEELNQIVVPEGITAASGVELERLQTELRRASSTLDEATAELSETQQKLHELKLAPEFLQAEPQIRSLEKEVSRVQRDRDLVPQLQSESRTLLTDVESRLAELNPVWDLSYLDGFRSSLEQRETLDELGHQRSQLEKRRAELAARRPDLEKRVTEATARLAEMNDVQPLPELDGILERESGYRAAATSLEEAAQAQASLSRQMAAQRKRLSPVLANPDLTDDELTELPVPLESMLRAFHDRYAEADAACLSAEAKRQSIIENLKSRQDELAARASEESVPDRQQLERQRERRDAGWKLIRRKFLADFEPQPDGGHVDEELEDWIGHSTAAIPEVYEHEVSETDRLADDRQAKAKTVAIRDRLAAEIAQLDESLTEATNERDAQLKKREEVSGDWQRLLAGFDAQPHPPEVLLEWHRNFETWLELRTKLTDSQTRSAMLSGEISDFENLLISQTEDESANAASPATVDQRLAAIRRRADEIKAATLERRQIEKSLPADRDALKRLADEDQQLDDQEAAWRQAWSSLLSEFGFPDDWSVKVASKILQGLHDARQKYQESKSLTDRANSLGEGVARFLEEAAAVCKDTCPELSNFPITDMVARLSERLEQALQAAREQTSLQRDEQRITERLEASRRDVEKLSSEIGRLLNDSGIPSGEEFLIVAQQAQRRQELVAEQTSLTRDLKRTAGAEKFDDFLAELADSDTDTLPSRLAEAQREYREIDARRDEARSRQTEAKNARESLDGTSRAAALQLEQESSYARLGSAIDRLAPLVLAQTLLKRAIERFEKEHQPAMLTEVGRLLSRMTAGRYVSIRRRLDEAGTMLIEQQNGKLKTPDQLSTGTREQLYLAIRLAYVQQYCRESEPLPLIMDDILVNFDEQRAKNTLDVLLALPDHIQVLFLTCHEHMAELVRKSRPDLSPIELSMSHSEHP